VTLYFEKHRIKVLANAIVVEIKKNGVEIVIPSLKKIY